MEKKECFGRERAKKNIRRRLAKSVPDSLTFIGPQYIGKTTLVKTLINEIQQDGKWLVIYFDFEEQRFSSDSEFWECYMKLFLEALAQAEFTWHEGIATETVEETMADFSDLIKSPNVFILTVFDHFDRVLKTDVTNDTWRFLRNQIDIRKNVTAWAVSQQSLFELCKSPEMDGSFFWNVFSPEPVQVGVADNNEIEQWIELSNLSIDSSGKKEIVNWTGAMPYLLNEFCERLADHSVTAANISKEIVDQVGNEMALSSERVKAFWQSCSSSLRQDLYSLHQDRKLRVNEIRRMRADQLVSSGMAEEIDGRISSSCKLIDTYAKNYGKDATEIVQLFKAKESFEKNISEVLRLRLKAVRKRHSELYEYIERAIQGINDPDAGLVFARKIRSSALSIIWSCELDEEGKIPEGVATYWIGRVNSNWDIYKDIEQRARPVTESDQLRLLDWLTGKETYRKMAKHLTKPTFVALQHVHELGNYDNHSPENEGRGVLFGCSLCMSALTVLENLTEELQ